MEFPFLKWKLDSRLHTQKRAVSEGQVICEGSEILSVSKTCKTSKLTYLYSCLVTDIISLPSQIT